jgi:hypothetical protein
MNTEEAKGLIIFAGTWALLAMFVCGCMERRLRRLNRIVRDIDEDMTKYVN